MSNFPANPSEGEMYQSERGWANFKASWLDVLDFIRKNDFVTIHDLIDTFGYRYDGARSKLYTLKKWGYIENLERGKWFLTEKGYKKLSHYGRI